MSFHVVEPATPRLHRSELAVPGIQTKFFEKAAKSAADAVFLDLEDSVAPDDKERARKNVIEALNDIDWADKTIAVRINGLDTHYMYRDVVDVMEKAGRRLDLIMIPKVGTASDVYAVDMLVTQIETALGNEKRIGFSLLIETALGMANVEAIAGASRRNEVLNFGPADYAASIGARTTRVGGANPDYVVLADADAGADDGRAAYWGDMWHYALSRVVVAARANGLRPIDGPFGDFGDPAGFLAAARSSAALGFEGKWAIHPSQIVPANEVFSPSAAEVAQARRIIDAMEQAAREGAGAVALDGRLIDFASIRQAEVMVGKAELIAARGGRKK